LLVAAHGVAGLRNGWWSFDAAACSLTTEEIPTPTDDFLGQQQVLAALQQPPVAAIVIVASFVRTLLRYPAGTVHVWRDAGALLATLHLCATDIGLRSCITGGVGLLRADRWDEMTTDVGAVVLGR
jgi:SagB-type dehydrogenase family enzyme